MSRPQRRLLSIAAASAVLLTVAPFTGVASAAGLGVSARTSPGQVIGPNQGFLDATKGISGRTAVFRIDVPATSTTITGLTVKVAGSTLSVFRDFDNSDGFQLFKNTALPDGFSQAEFEAGPVSTGFLVGASDASGRTPVTLSFPAGGATGAVQYFLTLHPAAADAANRDVVASIDAGAVATSAGATPAAPVSTHALTIDSSAPGAPLASSFARAAVPPPAEDSYNVTAAEAAPDKRLAFFNSATDTSLGNVLSRGVSGRAVTEPVLGAINAKIGNGTGRTATQLTAVNNQTGDGVWVRGVDSAGNLSAAAALTTAALLNDVTAPTYSSLAATTPPAINTTNQAAFPVTCTATGGAGIAKHEARVSRVDGSGNPIGDFTGWFSTSTTATAATVNVDTTTLEGGDGDRYKAQCRLIDALGNISNDGGLSASFFKDLVVPTFLSVSPITAGETYRITFSEPMDKASITEGEAGDLTAPSDFKDHIKIDDPTPETAEPNWGNTPGWEWSSDGRSGVVTVGTHTNPVTQRAPTAGDIVSSTNDGPTDLAGQKVVNTAVIPPPPALVPVSAVTADELTGVFAGADGKLDTIRVTVSPAVAPGSVTGSASSWRITGPAGTVTPHTASTTGDNTVITLRFDSTFGTGEVPTVTLLAGNGLSPGNAVSFVVGTSDGAAPAVLSIVTRDLTHPGEGLEAPPEPGFNGRIDTLVVTYSEPIDHEAESPEGYYTTDSAYRTENAALVSWNSKSPSSEFSPTTLVDLQEQDAPDTGATPALEFATSVPNGTIQDAAGNELATFAKPSTDGAGPVVLTRKTVDFDTDGRIDGIDVTFSEILASSSSGLGQFTVDSGLSFIGVLPSGQSSIRALVTEQVTPDTAALPKIRYLGGPNGGLKDTATNSAPAEPALVASTDGAGPAIVTAALNFAGTQDTPGDGETMRITLSEAGVADMAVDDFSLVQGNRTVEPEEIAAVSGNTKAFDLKIDPAFDPYRVATVEFTGDGAVTDAAGNNNTQIGRVASPGYPGAMLAFTCPPAPAICYRTTRNFATGATGNSNVVKWLLVVKRVSDGLPVAPTSISDARWTTVKPTHVNSTLVPVNTDYRMWLWTADANGNIAHKSSTGAKAEKTFRVDANAPTVNQPVATNFDGATILNVRDNDQLRVKVAAFGADAKDWVASQTSIDYRNLSGNPADGAVAPFTFTAFEAGENDRRDIAFPFRVASGTTKYPVGTVLKAQNGSTLWFMDDGVGGQKGKIVRRPLLSSQAMATYLISTGQVITVPGAVLNPMPVGPLKVYRDGVLVRDTAGSATYVISEGKRRGFSSMATFTGQGYSNANVIVVPQGDLAKVPLGAAVTAGVHPVGTYVRNAATNGVSVLLRKADGTLLRRPVATAYALSTLVRAAEVITVPTGHPDLSIPTDSFLRGVRDGMLFRDPASGRTYVISRGARRLFTTTTVFAQMGYSESNVVSRGGTADYARIAGQPVVDGRSLGFYPVTYTIRVGDRAGNVTTRSGSLLALGTPDPLPTAGYNPPRP